MTSLAPLRILLERIHSQEICAEVLAETARLFHLPHSHRWYFLLVNRIFVYLIDEPDMFYGVDDDNPSPVLRNITQIVLNGISAIERDDRDALAASANDLTKAYSAF